MNKIIICLLLSAFACRAELISIGISPAGSDAAVGLSPSNEVPPVKGSTGSGGTVSGGIVFDTDTSVLQIAAGYGSAAGFANLTGAATSATLNGPAGTNQNAGVLVDLSSINFSATNAALGGVIMGSVNISSNEVAELLNGQDYINVTTASNSTGEIRGQLIPLTPLISCPEPATIDCATPYNGVVTVQDPQGLALNVVWLLNGITVQTNDIPAGAAMATNNVTFNAVLPLGTNKVEVVATDSGQNTAFCSTTVIVVDTNPPVIVSVSATPDVLWPPNHELIKVTVKAKVTDPCDATTWKIISVTSNEAVDMKGSGHAAPDWVITGDHTVELRAERSGTGDGRIYTITIQAVDVSGNLSAPATVTVTVPHDQGKKGHDNDNDKGKGNGKGKD